LEIFLSVKLTGVLSEKFDEILVLSEIPVLAFCCSSFLFDIDLDRVGFDCSFFFDDGNLVGLIAATKTLNCNQ